MSSVMVRDGAAAKLLFVVVRCSWASSLRTFGLWGRFLSFFKGFFGETFVGVRHPDSIPLGNSLLLVG
jgi:hypothetical protein